MAPKRKSTKLEESLKRLLDSFDAEDKRKLARQLASLFGSNRKTKDYSVHIEKILKRQLTEIERFKISVLEKVETFHNIESPIPAPQPGE